MTAAGTQSRTGGRDGRLTARPRSPGTTGPTGVTQVGTSRRPALLAVPSAYSPGRPAPLVVMLHGASGTARHGLDLLLPWVERDGILLLAPASEESTWDVIVDELGPDVDMLDRALDHVFDAYAVEPSRIAIGGFSDGASYALTLGVANADLFTT